MMLSYYTDAVRYLKLHILACCQEMLPAAKFSGLIDKDILENIDIDMGISKNIDIDINIDRDILSAKSIFQQKIDLFSCFYNEILISIVDISASFEISMEYQHFF